MLPKQQFIRGVALETSANKLQTLLDRQDRKNRCDDLSLPDNPQLSIADFRLPRSLEDLGIFCVGSPGSGKTQAIAKLISQLKQRSNFRIVCFDRNGEFTTNFYDEEKDLLFNPQDVRSVGWCHHAESATNENIAASIIPHDQHEDKFWSVSARNLLTEIYERTTTNEQVWWVTSKMDTDDLRELLKDSCFNKYFESEKTFSSIIASATNYTRFYSQLLDRENILDFTKWARGDDSSSLFLPLFEENAELYKPLYSMVFELIIRGLLSNSDRQIKTAIIIDELGALQQLESLSRLLAEGRKFKACPIIATQTTAQIDKIYGKYERQILLQGTATKLILNCRDPDSAKTMAEIIGYQEVLEEYSDRSSNKAIQDANITTSIFREKYAVMPSEIQNLLPLQGFLMMGSGVPVVKAGIIPCDYPVIAKRLIQNQKVKHSFSFDSSSSKPPNKHSESAANGVSEVFPFDGRMENIKIYDRFGLLLTVELIDYGTGEEQCLEIERERLATTGSEYLIWKVRDDAEVALIQVASIHQVQDITATTFPVVLDRISHLPFYSEIRKLLGNLTFIE